MFEDALATLTADLVAIPSINPDLAAEETNTGEVELARFVAEWLERAGLDVELDEVAPGRPNVIAIVEGEGGGRSLMLNAHLDTVGVEGMERPFEPRLEDGRLYGRGALDMKGSLAACMAVAIAAADRGLRGDVILTAVIDEEYASLGTQAVIGKHSADAAIVTEPTELELCVAHKGFAWFDIETRGRAAHGSRPDLGVDAIAHMGRVLAQLEALGRSLRAGPGHPLLGHGSLHGSRIDGGQELSSYPARCRLQLERRTLPHETDEMVTGEIARILADLRAEDPSFDAESRMTLSRPPFAVASDEAIVEELSRQLEAQLGHSPQLTGKPFWMDAALLQAAGIPTAVFGPSGAGLHAEVEWVELSSLETLARTLLATAEAFCS